ncbi:hypothetical protein BDV3_000396 [Batrachochytrium dendrobatidis]
MDNFPISLFSRAVTKVFSYTQPTGVLLTWTNLAKAIRLALRTSYSHVPVPNNFDISKVSYTSYTGYYLPFAILVALLILSLIFTTLTVCCECCCLTCCRRYVVRRRIQAPNAARRICNIASLVILVIIITGAAIGTFYAVGFFTTTLSTFKQTSLASLNDTNNLALTIVPVINHVFSDLKVMVNSSIDSVVASVHFDVLNTSVIPALIGLASGLESTQNTITALLLNSTVVDGTRNASLSISNSIVTTSMNISNLSTNLSSTVHPVNSYSWSLSTSVNSGNINTAAQNILSDASSSPSSGSVLNSLNNVPNLTTYALDIRTTANTVPNNVINLVNQGSTTFKGAAGPGLENARASIVSSLGGTVDGISAQIQWISTLLSGSMTTVTKYNGYVTIGLYVILSIYFLIFLIMSIGICCKSPRTMKGANLAFTPYYVILHILALVFVIVAVPLGDVCTVMYDGSPPYIQQVMAGSPTAGMINAALVAVPLCYQNQSFIDVAVKVGLLNGSMINVTQQASDKINSFNFSAVTSGWDISSSVDTSNNPTSKLTNVNSVDLSGFNITSLDDARQSSIPALKNNLVFLDNELVGLYNQASSATTASAIGSYLTFTPSSPAPSDSQAVACNNDFLVKISDIRSNIQRIVQTTGYLDNLNTSILLLENQIVSLNSTATTLLGFTRSLPRLYNLSIDSLQNFAGNATANLTIAIPLVKNNMISFAAAEQQYVTSSFPCYSVAEAYYSVQDGMCGGVLTTFDALWLTFSILAVGSFISIPIVILTANSLFPAKTGGLRGGSKKMVEAPAPKGVEQTREMEQSPYTAAPPDLGVFKLDERNDRIYPNPQNTTLLQPISLTPFEYNSLHEGDREPANSDPHIIGMISQPMANLAILLNQPRARIPSQVYSENHPHHASQAYSRDHSRQASISSPYIERQNSQRAASINHQGPIMSYDVVDGKLHM